MENFEKWKLAQLEEAKHHSSSLTEGVEHFRECYRQYFDYVGIEEGPTSKTIIEIGCANIPALLFYNSYSKGYIIEPLPSEILKTIIEPLPITLFAEPAEHVEFPLVDEVWLFNVLQHVIDPDVLINKCKVAAKTIRFFEPINVAVDECHLHSFSLDYFKSHFGDSVKYYEDHKGRVTKFHDHECAYGVWNR